MRKLICLLLLLTFSDVIYSQTSGYMGKRLFAEGSIRLDPYIDSNTETFMRLGYDLTGGYVLSNRTALAVNYSIVNRPDYNSNYIGINFHLYRPGYIAPVGKTWLVGGGILSFDELEEVRINSATNEIETELIQGKSLYLRVGHGYRTMIKGSNVYFATEVALSFVAPISGESSLVARSVVYEGKLGFGVVL